MSDIKSAIEEALKAYVNVFENNQHLAPEQLQKKLDKMRGLLNFNSLKSQIKLAIPSIIKICREELPKYLWENIRKELEAAPKNLEEALARKDRPPTYRQMYQFSQQIMDQFDWAGSQYYLRGEQRTAIAIYTYLCLIDPLVSSYWLKKGIACQDAKSYMEAIQAYEQAEELDQKNPFPLIYAAECYVSLFDRESAKEQLVHARSIVQNYMPDNKDAFAIIEEVQHLLNLANP